MKSFAGLALHSAENYNPLVNTRLLYVILIVQALFAFSLLYVGGRARENRRQDYLELTHRVISGHASEEDFSKLAKLLPARADAETVRLLFGLPLRTSLQLNLGDPPQVHKGEFWVYYPTGPEGQSIGLQEMQELKGAVRCFIIEFDAKTVVRDEFAPVVH